MSAVLETERLRLRPLYSADAPRLQELCGNWNVARMLERVPHPYPVGLAEDWIAGRPAARKDSQVYDFAIEYQGDLVGIIGLERRPGGDYALGYWLGEPYWGQGLASEAAERVIGYASEILGLGKVVSSHFADNPASARVLEKCGFEVVGRGSVGSVARDRKSDAVFVELRLETSC